MTDTLGQQRLQPLRWPQALQAYRFARRFLPHALCRKLHTMFALLLNLERAGNNLSMGLYDGEKMVGYMLVYFHDRSLYHQREERIVHIDEYCVEQDYRHWGKDFLEELTRQMNLTEHKSAVEALATEQSTQHWLSTQRFMKRRMGYTTLVRKNESVRFGHALSRIRWDAIENIVCAPQRALPMTKKSHQISVDDHNYRVVITQQPRQWLSLREQVAEQFSAQQLQEDEYAWQWWRYFGIGKELCVVAVYHGESLSYVAPWCVHFQNGERLLRVMGGAGYPLAQALGDASANQALPEILGKHVSTEVEARPDLLPSAAVSATQAAAWPKPWHWFGANRAAYDLHRRFQSVIKG